MSSQPQTPEITWDNLRAGLDRYCETKGWWHGVPIPSSTGDAEKLIIAKRAPMNDVGVSGSLRQMEVEFSRDGNIRVCTEADMSVFPVSHVFHDAWTNYICRDESTGNYFGLQDSTAKQRLDMFLKTVVTRRGAVSAMAEIKAAVKLSKFLNDVQWESYILSGAFVETGRSGVRYVLRRGLPTIALRERNGGLYFLAALCAHPLAYYYDTHCGSMPPSDDVLAHLLHIRCDEHFFWRKSVQHCLEDPRSGI